MPTLIALAIFTFYPIVQGILMSFQNKSGEWTLRNYLRVFDDPNFPSTIRNTLLFVVAFDLVMLPLAMLLATLLHQKGLKGAGIYRVLL